jgi:hypothetical protein
MYVDSRREARTSSTVGMNVSSSSTCLSVRHSTTWVNGTQAYASVTSLASSKRVRSAPTSSTAASPEPDVASLASTSRTSCRTSPSAAAVRSTSAAPARRSGSARYST